MTGTPGQGTGNRPARDRHLAEITGTGMVDHRLRDRHRDHLGGTGPQPTDPHGSTERKGTPTHADTYTPAKPTPPGYTDRDRALDADTRLEQLDGLAWHLVTGAVRAGVTDGNAAWALLKVAADGLVGYGRGSVTLADEVPTVWLLGPAHLEHRSRTVEADTDTERWMRTHTAWDAITGPWLQWLKDAERGVTTDVPARHRRGAAWAEKTGA